MTQVIVKASIVYIVFSNAEWKHESFHQSWDVNHWEHQPSNCWCHFLYTSLLNMSIDLWQPWNQIKLSDTRCRGRKILTTKLDKILYRLCHTKCDFFYWNMMLLQLTILWLWSFSEKWNNITSYAIPGFNTHLLIHKAYLLQYVPLSLQLDDVKSFFLSENIPMFSLRTGKA